MAETIMVPERKPFSSSHSSFSSAVRVIANNITGMCSPTTSSRTLGISHIQVTSTETVVSHTVPEVSKNIYKTYLSVVHLHHGTNIFSDFDNCMQFDNPEASGLMTKFPSPPRFLISTISITHQVLLPTIRWE